MEGIRNCRSLNKFGRLCHDQRNGNISFDRFERVGDNLNLFMKK